MTLPTQLVLRAILAQPTHSFYGLELGRLVELASGTVHPILARLERCGWLESHWEGCAVDDATDESGAAERFNAHQAGRPQRRFYRLTPDGAIYAARALQRVHTPTMLLKFHPGL